jgi:hypothetical protein
VADGCAVRINLQKLRQRLPIKWDLDTYNRDVNIF